MVGCLPLPRHDPDRPNIACCSGLDLARQAPGTPRRCGRRAARLPRRRSTHSRSRLTLPWLIDDASPTAPRPLSSALARLPIPRWSDAFQGSVLGVLPERRHGCSCHGTGRKGGLAILHAETCNDLNIWAHVVGGQGGIRTHGGLAPTAVFKTNQGTGREHLGRADPDFGMIMKRSARPPG